MAVNEYRGSLAQLGAPLSGATDAAGLGLLILLGDPVDLRPLHASDRLLTMLGCSLDELGAGKVSLAERFAVDFPGLCQGVAAGASAQRGLETGLRTAAGELVTVQVELAIHRDVQQCCVVALFRQAGTLQVPLELLRIDRLATLGTLATGVAHEINNPLTYVLLHLHRLYRLMSDPGAAAGAGAERGDAAETIRLLEEALEGAERVRTIVKDLLDFARADDARSEAVDVERVLDASVKLARSGIKYRAQVLRQPGGVPRVAGCEARLGQVFLNLLVNAAQAFEQSDPEHNRIVVSTRLDEPSLVLVEVADNGSGIAPEHLERIFEPFFTTKALGDGTGLGLAITRSIVESLGGRIAVVSTPGTGTAVRVWLPTASALPSGRASATGPPLHATASRGRVLVIEDEPILARAVATALSTRHEVVVCTGSQDGLQHIRNGPPFSVVLCDVIMPGMSGTELFRTVCAEHPEYASRFVFVTGGAVTPTDRDFLVRTGAPILSKPYDMSVIEELICERMRA
jgi:signal transduction histidine kinase/CheY-like chemotaxis protein